MEEARSREAALRSEWASIATTISGLPNTTDFGATLFNEQTFLEATCVVLAHVIYLPSARTFALLPFVSFMRRTGNGDGCDVDYDVGALSPICWDYAARLCLAAWHSAVRGERHCTLVLLAMLTFTGMKVDVPSACTSLTCCFLTVCL